MKLVLSWWQSDLVGGTEPTQARQGNDLPCAAPRPRKSTHTGLARHALIASLSCCALIATSGRAIASAPSETLSVDKAMAAFEAAKERAFRSQLELLRADSEAEADASAVLRRCEYLGNFLDEESGAWIEEAESLHADCVEELQTQFADVPEVQVLLFEQEWGEGVRARGEALLSAGASWDRSLRRRVAEHLYWQSSDDQRSGHFAVAAAELGSGKLVDEGAAFLAGQRKYVEAAVLLAKAKPAESVWDANARLRAALALPDTNVARSELRRHLALAEQLQATVVARIELRSGRLAAAQEALQRTGAADESDFAAMAFDLAMAKRDWRAASVHAALTADDFPEAMTRSLKLIKRHPASLGRTAIWPALAALFAIVLVLALMPALVLVPVHYRGLVRRARGHRSTPLFSRIGLWQAWFGCAVLFCVPLLTMMLIATDDLAFLFEGEIDVHSGQIFPAMLWGTLAALLVLLPTLAKFGPRHLLWGSAPMIGLWRIPVALLLVWAVGYGLALAQQGQPIETFQTRVITALIADGTSSHGLPVALMLLALLVPVLEELVFRGLLLGGLTQHIRFGWANLIQGLAFALMHDDPPRFVYYLAVGLAAGWLVRWSGALLPAILLHAMNNAVAFWLQSS